MFAKVMSRRHVKSKHTFNRAVGIGGGGARGAVPPPNNLHKYAVLLITKVCHFKNIHVCPPPPPNL